jgi:hypothetical protein
MMLIILILLGRENHELLMKNNRLEKAIKTLVYNKQQPCLGYMVPETVVKDLYVRQLLNSE